MTELGMFYAMIHETIEGVEEGRMKAAEGFRFIREQMDDFIGGLLRDSLKSGEALIQLNYQQALEAITANMLTAGHIENHLRKQRFSQNELLVMLASLLTIHYGKSAVDRIEYLKQMIK